jgi:hypothetical protein
MPGAGPILLFDKSLLQGLSVDEAVWLDTFYFPCITPLFFVETLADLEKEVGKGRKPEDVVGNLAEKTPLGGAINVHHRTLWRNELLGYPFELRHVPAVAGGAPVRTQAGRKGVVFDSPPETEALERWRRHNFLEIERDIAREWREALSGVDLDALFRQGREITQRLGRPRDLATAKALADDILVKPGSRYVRETLQSLEPEGFGLAALERWNRNGSPPIKKYAPYTAHVFLVDLFFRIALGADLIGRERASNTIDLAYLYYLPFCMAFTSSDNFHERTAPALIDNKQVFIPGRELKADLAKLDEHYSRLSDEEKAKGVFSFAHYPPVEGDFLVSKLWDKLMNPEWRQWAKKPREPKSKESEAKLIDEINRLADASRSRSSPEDFPSEPEAVLVQRMVPVKRGKWQMFPPEVLNAPHHGAK